MWLLFVSFCLSRTVVSQDATISGLNYGAAQFDGNGASIAQETPGTTLRVDHCGFFDMSATGNGGAIYSTNSRALEIVSCEFKSCSAEADGGCVYARGTERCSLELLVISASQAVGKGGAFYIDIPNAAPKNLEALKVEGCTVEGCSGGDESGSSIYMHVTRNPTSYEDEVTFVFKGNTVRSTADGSGYVVYADYDTEKAPEGWEGLALVSLTVDNCEFDNGGKSLSRQFFYFDQLFSEMVISNTRFRNINVDGSGGAFYIRYGATSWDTAYVTVSNCLFDSCHAAQNGGAIYSDRKGQITCTGSTFRFCVAGGDGGAVFANANMDDTLTIKQCSISESRGGPGTVIRRTSGGTTTTTTIKPTSVVLDGVNISSVKGVTGAILSFDLNGAYGNDENVSPYTFKNLCFDSIETSHNLGIAWAKAYGIVYQGCVFRNIRNTASGESSKPGIIGVLDPQKSTVTLTLDGCTFDNCICDGGSILVGWTWSNNQAKLALTSVVITGCTLINCQSKLSVIDLKPDVNGRCTISAIQVEDIQLYDCTSDQEVVLLEGPTSITFESWTIMYENVVPKSGVKVVASQSPRDIVLSGCKVSGNGATFEEAFVSLPSGSATSLELIECVFSNMAISGSNVFLFLPSGFRPTEKLEVQNCRFENIVLKADMFVDVPSLFVNESVFRNCHTPSGVIRLTNFNGDEFPVNGSVFENNTCDKPADGLSVYVKFSRDVPELSIAGCTFSGHIEYCPVFIEANARERVVTMSDCIFADNFADSSKGVICIVTGNIELDIVQCQFSCCSSEAIISLQSLSSTQMFKRLSVSSCRLFECSGLFIPYDPTQQNGPVVFENCSFTNGTVSFLSNAATLTVSGCEFTSIGSPENSAVIEVSTNTGSSLISESTFLFIGDALNITHSMINLTCSQEATAVFKACCFSLEYVPDTTPVFLNLMGSGDYEFTGDMCFDLPYSKAVLNETVVSGLSLDMFDCDRCSVKVPSEGGDPGNKGHLPPGAIAGIVIVVLLVVALVVVLVLYIWRKRRYGDFSTSAQTKDEEMPEETTTATVTTSDGRDTGVAFISEENPIWKPDQDLTKDTFEETY